MSYAFYLYFSLGALAGGFINGLSGTGTALFALGFYLVVLDPITAVAIVAFMAVLAGLQGLWVARAEIKAQPKRILRFLVPWLVGVPLGLSLLTRIDEGTLRLVVASLLGVRAAEGDRIGAGIGEAALVQRATGAVVG